MDPFSMLGPAVTSMFGGGKGGSPAGGGSASTSVSQNVSQSQLNAQSVNIGSSGGPSAMDAISNPMGMNYFGTPTNAPANVSVSQPNILSGLASNPLVLIGAGLLIIALVMKRNVV